MLEGTLRGLGLLQLGLSITLLEGRLVSTHLLLVHKLLLRLFAHGT